jgi:hypothetical protein
MQSKLGADMTDFFYIYNLAQAKFFIDSGLKVEEIGVGSKGDVFHRFVRNQEADIVFEKWRIGSPRYEGDLDEQDRSDNSSV